MGLPMTTMVDQTNLSFSSNSLNMMKRNELRKSNSKLDFHTTNSKNNVIQWFNEEEELKDNLNELIE